MELFYMCLVDGTPGCRYHHPNIKLAMVEAERLARKEQKGVSVLAVVAYCKPAQAPVGWQFALSTFRPAAISNIQN